MKLKLIASLASAIISATIFTTSAKASCENNGGCEWAHAHHVVHHSKQSFTQRVSVNNRMRVHKVFSSHKSQFRAQYASVGDRGPVVSMIKSMAPSYGVPTWFALRIAKIESGFNPRARGLAGEYGVYQLKCATARGIGFRGNCGQLLNASTNVRYGLKYLSMAVNSSHGNLRLAASKHNGGLGRKSLVPRYVAMVF
jgi:soluble lytic murein transglycosylase-like protein